MGTIARLARVLADRRLAIYVGGVALIAVVRAAPIGVDASPAVGSAIVAAALGLLTVTYLAEVAVRADAFRADRRYPIAARAGVGAGIVGVAVGGFLALSGRLVQAAPFLVGALLLVRASLGGSIDADDRERVRR